LDTTDTKPITNDLLTWLIETKPVNPRDDVLNH
jgi:hypothetical protein